MSKSIITLFLVAFFFACSQTIKTETPDKKRPNIVIIFLDDSGWADFEPFNKGRFSTPNVRQLAEDGTSFTNFYVPQAICSASRSALMTGCYPGRTKVFGAHPPLARGLDPKFATMGEVFQNAGYKTAVFGKWHLGDQPDTRPPARGFDESCGLMFSNDMWKHHPENPEYWGKFKVKYWENEAVVIEDVTKKDQKNLTRKYTEQAVSFIEEYRDTSFLLYLPHSMPHVPLFCSDAFQGKSGQGLYWDVIMELDWSVGQVVKALKEQGLEENTIVIFTSDNGPWTSYGNRAGLTPYREAKGTTFDGGIRSACIIKYPGKVPANQMSKRTFFTIDLLPTLCHMSKVDLPENEIDGKNVWPIMLGDSTFQNPQPYYAFSNGRDFQGVMSSDGAWKLHVPHYYRALITEGKEGLPGKYQQRLIDTSLFHLEVDPFEMQNVVEQHPDIAKKLLQYAHAHEQNFFSKESTKN